MLPTRIRARRSSDEEDNVAAEEEEGEEAEETPLPSVAEGEEGVAEEVRLLRAVVNGNLAACYLAKKQFKEAVEACNEALQDDPLYLKALYRRAQANEEIATWSSLTSALEGESGS